MSERTAHGIRVFKEGGDVPNFSSSNYTDNGINLTNPDFGSSVAGDGYAGKLGLTIDSGGNVSVSSFNQDALLYTTAGTRAYQHDNPAQMSGSVNLVTGELSLVMTGRLWGYDAGNSGYACAACNIAWNNDDVGPFQEYSTFRTSSASTDTNSINGAVLSSLGDVNGDSITDYKAVLVSGGDYGSASWAFEGTDYFEVWSIQLLSQPAAVPIPAAVWLFGSGLLGVAAAGRRRKRITI